MAELPLLPLQQRTTTQYNPGAPKHRPVAFRPKRHFAHIPHTNTIITINTNTNMISASPYSHPEEKNEEKEEKEQQEEKEKEKEEFSLIPFTPVCSRALYWLMYAEEQERGLIYRSYVATSPLLQCDTDAALSAFTRDAFTRREARLNAFVLHRQQLEVDETMERWQNVEEPWERVCHELRLVQELLEGKLLIWNMFLQQLNTWQQLLQLVVEEKRARLAVLSSFISCNPPHPCRCLLWDMEVLEESAIPLEPAVNLPCLFVSIVIGECDVIHSALLAQRKKELAIMKAQLINCMEAYEVLRNIELDEQERFETLMGYHAFCMKIAKEKEELLHLEKHSPQEKEKEEKEKEEIKKQKKYYFPRRYGGTQWSPYFDYYKYLHIVKTISLEETFRHEIETFEGVEARFLMFVYQTDCRLAVTREEEAARRTLLEEMEDWERNALNSEANRSLEEELQPDNFLLMIHSMMQSLKETRAQQLEAYCITISLQLLVEYEHQRRGEYLLLEKKLRTERRLLFCHICGYGEKRVADRWMLQHEMLVIMREEERLRLGIEQEEAETIATRATAHEWMVEYTDELRRKMLLKEIKQYSTELLEEYKQCCNAMESQWLEERLILFEKKLTIPLSNDESIKNEMVINKSSKNSVQELDIRRIMISDLADFLDDHVLLSVFASS